MLRSGPGGYAAVPEVYRLSRMRACLAETRPALIEPDSVPVTGRRIWHLRQPMVPRRTSAPVTSRRLSAVHPGWPGFAFRRASTGASWPSDCGQHLFRLPKHGR